MVQHLHARLVCSSCKGELAQSDTSLQCHRCLATYLIENRYVSMLDRREQVDRPSDWNRKEGEIRDYSEISNSLALSGIGRFATFLNYGYVSTGNEQHAVIEPDDVWNRNSVKLLLEVVGRTTVREQEVIDIGCGRGGNIAALHKYFKPLSIVGLDICPANIAYCSAKPRLTESFYLVGDAENIPFADESFDVVLNMESAHAYPNRTRFYEEVYRIMRYGGVFLYTELMLEEEVVQNVRLLEEAGLTVIRNQDVTSNVLLSCDENAKQRTGAQGIANNANASTTIGDIHDFIALPGSKKYEEMKAGTRQYRMMNLVKR
ncbi:methyltransferase family protein [Paenibacillus cellulosilyticus]|uniref:Methyltransferase family protein n=1 Tax=Paenibacillus cellulosilyticus TaxID=375489 RepID=A0A2V2YQX9_9BACL|nr:class I SAM-dependent methyltransferase [Paenibacillus cellulosilyticus]PWV99300.1 methyltransferase family protein [Paenibacillus cellulosilyticus]QKS45065.1 class I SAM-dependent methyltransferase [Paenibacillus cellulosilyticus]